MNPRQTALPKIVTNKIQMTKHIMTLLFLHKHPYITSLQSSSRSLKYGILRLTSVRKRLESDQELTHICVVHPASTKKKLYKFLLNSFSSNYL